MTPANIGYGIGLGLLICSGSIAIGVTIATLWLERARIWAALTSNPQHPAGATGPVSPPSTGLGKETA